MAVLIFMLSLGILFIQSRNFIRQEATEHAASVLSTTMQRINQFMNNVEVATDINDWEVTENLNPDSLLAYSRYIVTMNGIDGCSISTEPFIFPKHGRYFSAYTVRETDTITTVIEKEYEYFQKVWYKTPKMLDAPCWVVYFDETDSLALTLDGMIASYSKPLYDANKRFVGVVSSDLSLINLSKVISQEKPYPGSYFIMTGDEGRYFIHPDSTLLFNHTIFSDLNPHEHADIIALGHEMTSGKRGSMRVKMDGQPCLVCYEPVPDTKWSLALVCPEHSVLQSYNRLSYILVPLTVIGLLLILLFSSITVTQAIHPLVKLDENLQRIANGHYDERINRSKYNDAVGRLQNSFATMQESLNRHVNEIQRINAETAQRNEELVEASELAKEGSRQKTLFIQDVSHQIRTPLNIIMGFAQVLRESKSFLPQEEAQSIMNRMSQNALTLSRMSLMLFDSSPRGITEEQFANKDERVFCNEMAQTCIANIGLMYPDQPDLGITLETTLPYNFYIRTNRLFLTRSIQELLYNATKYSDRQHIVLQLSEEGDSVRFVVQDTGPGIAEEESTRLFEMFTKVNDLSDGLGLGLPLAMRHITNLGGDLTLDANYHDGCRIIIQMPKRPV